MHAVSKYWYAGAVLYYTVLDITSVSCWSTGTPRLKLQTPSLYHRHVYPALHSKSYPASSICILEAVKRMSASCLDGRFIGGEVKKLDRERERDRSPSYNVLLRIDTAVLLLPSICSIPVTRW